MISCTLETKKNWGKNFLTQNFKKRDFWAKIQKTFSTSELVWARRMLDGSKSFFWISKDDPIKIFFKRQFRFFWTKNHQKRVFWEKFRKNTAVINSSEVERWLMALIFFLNNLKWLDKTTFKKWPKNLQNVFLSRQWWKNG